MELSHPCGPQGANPTHDFLSLATQQQDHHLTPTIPGHLQTHDFLQPLEQIGKGGEYIKKSKSLPPSPQTIEEHILPGGMGTYSLSHISYINQQSQKVPKHDGNVISAAQSSSSNNNDENSNCSSYTGCGFNLWEDSNVNKGKTRKENINIAQSRPARTEGDIKIGVPSQSSYIRNHPSTTFSSLSSSRPLSAPKNRYVVDTVTFGKNVHEEEDFDEEFVIKKEPSFNHKGGISVKIDTTSHDQRSNSPRSKHSATEQRRRSKINDRFSMLRGIIPHGDQKRDKASFLLEVIEYIQFLQEKVNKYEDSPQLPNNKSTIPTNTQNLLDSSTSQVPQSTNKPQPNQLSYGKSCTRDGIVASDKLKDEEVIIESGTISISTIYSQGLSGALTQALKTSGVDLSHAKISVQIDLGTRSNTPTLDSSPPDHKEHETPSIDQTVTRSRLASTWEDQETSEALKRSKPNRK